ncbi:hypothetical protein P8452_46614 [Trifolium repens]|nr:hypothetical protein P8452_46614 [Trifolium repens]
MKLHLNIQKIHPTITSSEHFTSSEHSNDVIFWISSSILETPYPSSVSKSSSRKKEEDHFHLQSSKGTKVFNSFIISLKLL